MRTATHNVLDLFRSIHFVPKMFPNKSEDIHDIELGTNIVALKSGNESGPCRDRTDDPQIKSVSDEDESMPD